MMRRYPSVHYSNFLQGCFMYEPSRSKHKRPSPSLQSLLPNKTSSSSWRDSSFTAVMIRSLINSSREHQRQLGDLIPQSLCRRRSSLGLGSGFSHSQASLTKLLRHPLLSRPLNSLRYRSASFKWSLALSQASLHRLFLRFGSALPYPELWKLGRKLTCYSRMVMLDSSTFKEISQVLETNLKNVS